jgi:response regulator RpfG family c-di-GMP phosphodiesterase
LKQHLEKQSYDVITTNSNKDAINIVLKDASVHAIIFDWTMDHPEHARENFMKKVRDVCRNCALASLEGFSGSHVGERHAIA